jgi:tetratricopeptide (TPR) repeat protein
MIKAWIVIGLLAGVCAGVYWPHKNAQFVLDDYYTVVRNPLIKNPSLYQRIWTSRLFDAHPSSGYIKFGYWRPLLESSWIADYRWFGLKAWGYQWINLLIHALNCFLVYVLYVRLFGQTAGALKAALLFAVLPTQEWVVRYVTGRGDELSAFFALLALIFASQAFTTESRRGYIPAILSWALASLTREVALSYILYALLIYFYARGNVKSVGRFCFWWFIIGTLPFLIILPMVPKQGNILIWHVFYLGSAGVCWWLAQRTRRWFLVLFILFAGISFYQGCFWSTEETLLRHTRSLEFGSRTVVAQQLLMKYDDDTAGIRDMVDHSPDPLIKAMWLRRMGIVYFSRQNWAFAKQYFLKALDTDPFDIDSLDALAVVSHNQGEEQESLKFLERALKIDPFYPDTLRTLGIHYYLAKDFPRARFFLSRSLFFDPDNAQARQLLYFANRMN